MTSTDIADVSEQPQDLGSGRSFRYEWESVLADVLTRLAAVEAGGAGGSSTEVTATAAPSQATKLLDLKWSDSTSAVYYLPNDGTPADGGDLYVQTPTTAVDVYAYAASASVSLWMSGGGYGGLSAYDHGCTLSGTGTGTAQWSLGADDTAGTTLGLTRVAGQSADLVTLKKEDGSSLVTVSAAGDVIVHDQTVGVVLTASDGSQHRIVVATDGTLSTTVVT